MARLEGLSSQNIRSGWKAIGLWPLRSSKALLSPLLLENSQPGIQSQSNSALTQSTAHKLPLEASSSQSVLFSTPRKAKQLYHQLQENRHHLSTDLGRRILSRKIQKVYDERDFELAKALEENKMLRKQIEAQRPSKRRKVDVSPNSKFAGIEAIQRAQNAVNRDDDSLDEESSIEVPTDEEDCIVVGE